MVDTWHDADMERWLDGVLAVTPRTLILELDESELRSLLDTSPHPLLERRVDRALRDLGGFGFVKLSCRSPKVVCFCRSKVVVWSAVIQCTAVVSL